MFGSVRALKLTTLLTALLATGVQALPKVTRTGRYLFDEAGDRFYIKGIAYQEQGVVIASDDNHFGEPSTFVDPLALPDACRRDLPYLQELKVNAIRVYSVNSSLNHDECMKMFNDAGIYTIIDLALPLNGSIDRLAPAWSTNVLNQYIATIDAFTKYENVLGYNIGNEVVLGDSTGVAPYVKAAARDTRAYIKSKGIDTLLGYAAINGNSAFRSSLANYLSCDNTGANSDASAIDLYGLKISDSWCGASSFANSYSGVTREFANYNVVAYFGEFGCNKSPPRLWTETEAMFSTDMNQVWSGGIAFSYFPARSGAGEFGMVTVSEDGTSITTSGDYDRLVTEYNKVSFINSPSKSSVSASTFSTCPPTSSTWVASNNLPPTPNNEACNCLQNTLSCQYKPPTANYSVAVGELLNFGCSLVGQNGGSCEPIGGDGTTGVYGDISGCDPTIKLSYVMSQFYESQDKNAEACSFGGNGTVNSAATNTANAAASACIANPGIFTPSAAPTGGPGATPSNDGSSGNNTGAGSTLLPVNALLGLGLATCVSVLGGVWTLM